METTQTTSMATGTDDDPLIPPGFRFYPTEEELLGFYLRHRLAGTRPDVERLIPVVDLYSYHPRDLQSMAGAASVSDTEQWFFFCPRAAREAHGGRPARTTPSGYWKATGSPSLVFSSSSSSAAANPPRVIGEKRTMVFYQGRAPTGTKTRWKMNEYKAVADDAAGPITDVAVPPLRLRNEFSVCRVYISTGTLRSFDRRPLNTNHQAALLHHRQQQLLVAATTSGSQQQVAVSNYGYGKTTANADDDSSSSGSRGMVIDGADDDAAIDWDSLVTPPPADDLTRAIWPQYNQRDDA